MNYVTCRQFFDGETLHGSHRITYNTVDNTILNLEECTDSVFDFDLLTPGLVDLQMNGFDQWYVASATTNEEMLRLDQSLAACGTTSWLATLITDDLNTMKARIAGLNGLKRLKGLKGLHLEGPFLGRAPGAHSVDYIIPVDLDFLTCLPACVKLVTLAPEAENAVQGIKILCEKGIIVSLGHSKPTREEYEQAVKAGASMITHLYNGMSGVSHSAEPGLALQGLMDDQMTVGIIADGVHVNPLAVKLAFRAKPVGRICIVSDTVPADKRFTLKNGAYYLTENGILAGSCSPISIGLKNAIHSGVPVLEALKAVTSTPAKRLNLDAGYIRIGEKCPMVGFDAGFNILRVLN
jgi:N-acetylglucosamine-6-phosphate deacetylase